MLISCSPPPPPALPLLLLTNPFNLKLFPCPTLRLSTPLATHPTISPSKQLYSLVSSISSQNFPPKLKSPSPPQERVSPPYLNCTMVCIRLVPRVPPPKVRRPFSNPRANLLPPHSPVLPPTLPCYMTCPFLFLNARLCPLLPPFGTPNLHPISPSFNVPLLISGVPSARTPPSLPLNNPLSFSSYFFLNSCLWFLSFPSLPSISISLPLGADFFSQNTGQ